MFIKNSLLVVDQVIQDFESRKQRIEQLEHQVRELEENVSKHRAETDVVRQRWLNPLKDMIGLISSNFSAYFTAMKCAGEVCLSIPPNQVSVLSIEDLSYNYCTSSRVGCKKDIILKLGSVYRSVIVI